MEPLKLLAKLYQSFLAIGAERSHFIESKMKQYLNNKESMADSLIFDEDCYQVLFSPEYFSTICELFVQAQASIKIKTFEESQDEINFVAFLQDLFATGHWKYNYPLPDEILAFTKNFDRLEEVSERRRFYDSIKS